MTASLHAAVASGKLTDSWPSCAPAECESQSREESCQSTRFRFHI